MDGLFSKGTPPIHVDILSQFGNITPTKGQSPMTEFNLRNLSVLNYANGFTSWHYKTQPLDNMSQVLTVGFFDKAKNFLADGDRLFISHPDAALDTVVFRIAKKITGLVDKPIPSDDQIALSILSRASHPEGL